MYVALISTYVVFKTTCVDRGRSLREAAFSPRKYHFFSGGYASLDISLRSEFVIFAGSSTSHKIMQTNERYTRRLATLFLGLFLSLLAMVSLHDFSHRADAVQDVVSTEGYTSHVTKTDCSICHFVHTPFLALAIGTLLATVALGVCLLGVRLVRLAHSIRRDAVQLRAPPTFA
jgi:hypothetical protein